MTDEPVSHRDYPARASGAIAPTCARARAKRIAEHIGLLGANPRDPGLNIKTLANDADARLRLRVCSYRVKYNRDDHARVIQIIRIGHRREVYR